MMKASILRGLCVSSFVLAAVACGSSQHSAFDDDDGGPDTTDQGEGGPITDPGKFGGADGGLDGALDPDTGLNACAADTQQAKLAPLDLMLMQDTSGSMWSYVSGTKSKWTAVKDALSGFMADPGSAGIGLGIQFFPLFQNGVPNSCKANAQCGASGGDCIYKACSSSLVLCESNADCNGGGDVCTTLKRCHNAQESFCLANIDCQNRIGPIVIDDYGPCDLPIAGGVCNGEMLTCAAADYAAPAAPIAALPGAATGINAALAARIPNGQTPTKGALQGAIDAAKAYSTAHAGHVVAVVLSTDGLPYTNGTCDDDVDNIAAVAAAGLAGTPSIKTFVIGVFAPSEKTEATTTLNKIAAAGGTGTATILGTSATTTADFIKALNKIRGQSLPCEFALPVPEAGTPDYDKVNVVFTDSKTKAQKLIGYVGSAGACDPTKGGWYYDADPSEGGAPSKVILCPATCSLVQADPLGQVNVVQGCETKTQEGPH